MAWAEARRGGGDFLLRMEDIDGSRCRREFEDAILTDLRWLGFTWNEPVWRQSDRMEVYAGALRQLDSMGLLYPCFCSRHDLMAIDAPQGPDGPVYQGTCRSLAPEQRHVFMAEGRPFALRLDAARAIRMTGPLRWLDLDRGEQVARPELLGDAVLARKDIRTSYHLAVVVDDAAQGITVVTRGDDLLASTHLHRLLQALLALPVPVWRHHRLVCDESGKRLAKRDGARAVQALRAAGQGPREVFRMAGVSADAPWPCAQSFT
jgi:glutamyl-Q tRNA(Asp) synthetase